MSEVPETIKKIENGIINRLHEGIIYNGGISSRNVATVDYPEAQPDKSGLYIQIYYAGSGPVLYPTAPFDYRHWYLGVAIFYNSFCDNIYTKTYQTTFILEVANAMRDLILFSNLENYLELPTQLADTGAISVEAEGKTTTVLQQLYQISNYPRHFDDMLLGIDYGDAVHIPPLDEAGGDVVDPSLYVDGGTT